MNGMFRPESALEFLIIDDSPNETEAIISALRNEGLAVHYQRVSDEAELVEALTNPDLDMILLTCGTEAVETFQGVLLCRNGAPDLPLIIRYPDGEDPVTLLDAMRKGARDLVSTDDLEHLKLVVAREYNDLAQLRELKQLRASAQEMEQRCNALVEHSRDAIAYVHEGMFMQANPVFLDMFGYMEMEEIEGMPILDMVDSGDQHAFKEFLRSLDQSAELSKLELHCKSTSGKVFDAELEFSPASVDGEPCTQIMIRDRSLDKEMAQKISQLTRQDSLTGLANRQCFMERLEEALAADNRAETPCSLLYILLDDYQKFRTSHGITASDSVLKEVAELIKELIQEGDMLARFGDHTFIICSSSLSEPAAVEAYAEKIRTAIGEHVFSASHGESELTCSIGLSHLAAGSEGSAQDMINQAYNACESVRDDGGNQAASYAKTSDDPGYEEKPEENTKLENLLRDALDNDRFQLVFQPIVSLQGDTRENYAVLIRLLDENDNCITPEDFFYQAEQSSMMAEIDRWVIKHAIKELAQQRENGHKIKFFINISSQGIEDESMLLWICDCLREYNAKGPWLAFQFHESDLRNHAQNAKKLADGLAKIRCQLALDRFGLQPRPETLLKHIPVDYIKLDGSFTKELPNNTKQQEKMQELNKMLHSMSIKTVAVEVEDANCLAALWTIGADYVQGDFLQKPSDTIAYEFNAP